MPRGGGGETEFQERERAQKWQVWKGYLKTKFPAYRFVLFPPDWFSDLPNSISEAGALEKLGEGGCAGNPQVPTKGTTNFKGKVVSTVPFSISCNGFCSLLYKHK